MLWHIQKHGFRTLNPDPQNLQLTTVCRSEMFMAVDAGDRSAEVDQVSSSRAVLTLVHLDAQPEPDPISDVEPT